MNMFGGFTQSGFSVLGQALESLGNIVAPDPEQELARSHSHEDGHEKHADNVTEDENDEEDAFDNVIKQYIQQKKEEEVRTRPKPEKKLTYKPPESKEPSDFVLNSPDPILAPKETLMISPIPESSQIAPVLPSPTSSLVEIELTDDDSVADFTSPPMEGKAALPLPLSLEHQTSITSINSELEIESERRYSISSTLSNEVESPISFNSSQWGQNKPNNYQNNINNFANQPPPSSLSLFSSDELEKKVQKKYRENLEKKYHQLETNYLNLTNEHQLLLVKLQVMEENDNIQSFPHDQNTSAGSAAMIQELEKRISNLNITINSINNENTIKDEKIARLTKQLDELSLQQQQSKEKEKVQNLVIHSNESTQLQQFQHLQQQVNQLQLTIQSLENEKHSIFKENQLLSLNNQDLLKKLEELNEKNISLLSTNFNVQQEINDYKQQISMEKTISLDQEHLVSSSKELIELLTKEKQQLQLEKQQFHEKEKHLQYENSLLEKVNKENEELLMKYETLNQNYRIENEDLLNSMKVSDEKYFILERNYQLLQQEVVTLQEQLAEHQQQQEQQEQGHGHQEHQVRSHATEEEEQAEGEEIDADDSQLRLQQNEPTPIKPSPRSKPKELSIPSPSQPTTSSASSPMKSPMKSATNQSDLQLKIISNYLISLTEKLQFYCQENHFQNPLPIPMISSSSSSSSTEPGSSSIAQTDELLLNYLHDTFQLFIQSMDTMKKQLSNHQEESFLSLQLLQQLLIKVFPELQMEIQNLFTSHPIAPSPHPPHPHQSHGTNNNLSPQQQQQHAVHTIHANYQFLLHSMVSILEQNIRSLQERERTHIEVLHKETILNNQKDKDRSQQLEQISKERQESLQSLEFTRQELLAKTTLLQKFQVENDSIMQQFNEIKGKYFK